MLIPLVLSMFGFSMSLLGLALLAAGYGLNQATLASLSLGLTGLVVSAVVWMTRPKTLMTWPKCLKRQFLRRHGSKKNQNVEVLDRDKAELVMKNIRGIPYLIQVNSKKHFTDTFLET